MLHDEPDCRYVHDAARNVAAHLEAQVGDVEGAFAAADGIFEGTYRVPQVQQCSIEPHIMITYLDEQGRLVVRTSTQVPFHVRRIVARVNEMAAGQVRVVKPRVGGGFGGKQEMMSEDLPLFATMKLDGRPVKWEWTREDEFARGW